MLYREQHLLRHVISSSMAAIEYIDCASTLSLPARILLSCRGIICVFPLQTFVFTHWRHRTFAYLYSVHQSSPKAGINVHCFPPVVSSHLVLKSNNWRKICFFTRCTSSSWVQSTSFSCRRKQEIRQVKMGCWKRYTGSVFGFQPKSWFMNLMSFLFPSLIFYVYSIHISYKQISLFFSLLYIPDERKSVIWKLTFGIPYLFSFVIWSGEWFQKCGSYT